MYARVYCAFRRCITSENSSAELALMAPAIAINSVMPLVVFHREALIQQRDALRSVGTWYLAPFIPGFVLFVLGRYFQLHAPGRTLAWDHQIVILLAVVAALIFGIVWLLNAWGTERLQRKIDQLDALRWSRYFANKKGGTSVQFGPLWASVDRHHWLISWGLRCRPRMAANGQSIRNYQ